MPLADAASKLLPKEGPDGTAKFDNPAVGDFQVLDALVEVGQSSAHLVRTHSTQPTAVVRPLITSALFL